METLDNWKLNFSSLYPIGLKHYGNDETAIVIIWSTNLLCTKKFKSFTTAIEQNLPADKDIIRQIGDSSISQFITGKLESVILTENGKLKYFETKKILRNVDYVGGIKSMCTSTQGFVILHINDGDIKIMIHPDSFPCTFTSIRSYDVSFERSFCQTTWNDAHFTIASLHANPDKPAFFNILRKCPGEQYTTNDSFIFFSINNTLLTLVVNEEDDYRHHQIHAHSSNIRGIHSSKDLNSIYVLLESGVIDVVYSCEVLGLMKTCSLFFMYDIGPYDICDDIFVYSDGFDVVVGRIVYSSDTRTYKSNQKTVPLPGIVAFTIVKSSKTVLCLSENRIFYKIPYSDDEFGNSQSEGNVMLPVNEFLSRAERATIDIQQLVNHYDQIKSDLSLQNKMFDAIALRYNYKTDKSVLRFPLKAKLKMYRTIPDLPACTIYPKTMTIDSNACFLHIQIQPHRFGKVFSTNIWSLSIKYETHVQTFSKVIRLFNEDFSQPLDILIALEIKHHIVPPKVIIDISTSSKIGEDIVCISLPVHSDILDYKDVIKSSNKLPNFEMLTSHRHGMVSPPTTQVHSQHMLTYYINLPKRIALNELLQSINPEAASQVTNNLCYLSLFNTFLELSIDQGLDDTCSKICLKSRDAAIMFHTKKLLLEHLGIAFNLSVDPDRLASIQKYVDVQGTVQCICSSDENISEKMDKIFASLSELRALHFR